MTRAHLILFSLAIGFLTSGVVSSFVAMDILKSQRGMIHEMHVVHPDETAAMVRLWLEEEGVHPDKVALLSETIRSEANVSRAAADFYAGNATAIAGAIRLGIISMSIAMASVFGIMWKGLRKGYP